MDRHPDVVGSIHVDDYQKKREDVPFLGDIPNWDHPDAIASDRLMSDLAILQRGESVSISTKNERDNPGYERIGRLNVVVQSKPVMSIVLHQQSRHDAEC